jgi:MFS family permease
MSFKRFFTFLSGIYFGWRMIGVVSAVRIIGGGLHSYGFTVFFLPITRDLGLSRAAMSLAFSLSRAIAAIQAPLVGYLVDRFGPRPILATAALFAGIGYMLLSLVNSYTSFLLVYLGVISLVFTAGFAHSPMVVANTWFIRRRARAMMTISAAIPVGGALISPLLAVAVNVWGWRWSALCAGLVFLLVAFPLSFLVRRSPESMGLLPDGIAPPKPSNATGEPNSMQVRGSETNAELDSTIGAAMRTAVFWVIVLSMTARMTAYSTISVHFVPLMVWKGLTQEQGAFLLGAFAFLNFLSHFLLGWIADLFNKPRLLTACMLAPALTVPLLIWGDTIWSLWIFTVFFSLLDSSFPILWATVGDFFGRKYFATIRGSMSFFYMWGSVVGPVLAGALYDRSQSYEMMLWGLFGLLLVAAFLNALLIKPWTEAQQKQFALSA